jgi:uncharacterized protein YabN with tetrapyrrole methylase and pyrophosphatase domain
VVVGTGIRVVSQTTQEAVAYMEKAGKLFYLVADTVTEQWIGGLNGTAESLYDCYAKGKPRIESYREMTERILSAVRKGGLVVAAFYGHPGVFVNPSHAAIRKARAEGFEAMMLPGVSAEDCLFADLGIDPAPYGCASFEATDFLLYDRLFTSSSHLILWQIGMIGELGYRIERPPEDPGLAILAETLMKQYSPEHEVVVYEAAQYPVCDPVLHRVRLAELPKAPVTPLSTLYVSPAERRKPNPEMMRRLAIAELPRARPGGA